MNWKLRIDYFHTLEEEDLGLFAPPGEVRLAAESYNSALELYLSGAEEEAKQRLSQISEDYPLFPQASHLYGVLLAADGEFEKAEYFLERVTLLDISEEEREHLEEEYSQARHEARLRRTENQRHRKREKMLAPVKREIASRSILQKVDRSEPGESDYATWRSAVFEDPKEKRKTALTAMIALAASVLVLLLFFFFWRPSILREQEKRQVQLDKLTWLEAELADRSLTSEDLARFFADYQLWLSEGRPPRPTEDEDNIGNLETDQDEFLEESEKINE